MCITGRGTKGDREREREREMLSEQIHHKDNNKHMPKTLFIIKWIDTALIITGHYAYQSANTVCLSGAGDENLIDGSH